jgi:hypothetical protein
MASGEEIRLEEDGEKKQQQQHRGREKTELEKAGMVASTGTGRKHAGDVKPQAEHGEWGGASR